MELLTINGRLIFKQEIGAMNFFLVGGERQGKQFYLSDFKKAVLTAAISALPSKSIKLVLSNRDINWNLVTVAVSAVRLLLPHGKYIGSGFVWP